MFMRPPTPPEAKARPSGLKATILTGVMWPFSWKTHVAPPCDLCDDCNATTAKACEKWKRLVWVTIFLKRIYDVIHANISKTYHAFRVCIFLPPPVRVWGTAVWEVWDDLWNSPDCDQTILTASEKHGDTWNSNQLKSVNTFVVTSLSACTHSAHEWRDIFNTNWGKFVARRKEKITLASKRAKYIYIYTGMYITFS